MIIKKSPLYAESWNVAYRDKPIGEILKNKKDKFNIIPNSFKYWAADPMVFEYNNTTYIFAELYDYSLCRGTIGYIKENGGRFTKWKQILVEDFHLSFPNVFFIGSDVYMIPESSESNQLLLYKATDFPEKWQRVKVIESGVKWVDTVIYQTPKGYLGFTEELSNPIKDYLLTIDKKFNIVSKEVISISSKKMRNGGRCFELNGKWVKVCQDCEEKYGGALIFRLFNDAFLNEEKTIRIVPEDLLFTDKFLFDGMHTYTANNKIEVVDIKTRRFNIFNLFFRIIHKIKNR